MGAGDHGIYIGYWDSNLNWWNTYKILKFKSSIISLAFHPSEKVIAAGSSDYTVKLISCCTDNPESEPENYKGVFEEINSFK